MKLASSSVLALCLALSLADAHRALADAGASSGAMRHGDPARQHDYVLNEFELFKQKFGKTYANPAEEAKRFDAFRHNLKTIQEHNLSGKSWKMGVTRYADLTNQEFVSAHLNGYTNTYKHSFAFDPASAAGSDKARQLEDLPAEVDWSEALSPVKDQGSCGSCWAFAATEMIESYSYLTNGTLEVMSPQQINSCTPNELQCGGSGGCGGSIPQLAYTYTELFGITRESEYPYVSGESGNTESCNYDASTAAAYVRGWELLPRNDLVAVMTHLAEVGPLSVAVDASNFGLYESGVFEGCDYDSNIAINHAVQLVGYGTDDQLGDYFTIRNSWGSEFGEEGFIRIRRDSLEETKCGTDSTPLIGTACENDGQAEQHVCGMCAVLFDVTYPLGAYLV